jgi:hypothetical protein
VTEHDRHTDTIRIYNRIERKDLLDLLFNLLLFSPDIGDTVVGDIE